MKNAFSLLRSRGLKVKAAVAALSLAAASGVHAALPSWATTAASDLGGSVGDFEGLVGPIILAVAVSMVGIKLFKRFTSKI